MHSSIKLKPVHEQVIVITGASSGIGLATARLAAKRGAAVVLASRNESALRQIEEQINGAGGQAVAAVADVADPAALRQVAQAAFARFGRFDTWINNAGVSIYGRLDQVSDADSRRLFETNFWGVVYGSLVAIEHLRSHGGALINIGSTLSDRAIPLQGMYCASKHAVKAFTDALRMELQAEGAGISVTLIKPAAIDTMYTQHARNYLPNEPTTPPPVYAPDVVARAILYAAAHPQRDIYVGGAAKAFSVAEKYAPRLTDKVMEAALFELQQTSRPAGQNNHLGLHQPGEPLRESGGYRGHVMRSSFYTEASLHPVLSFVGVLAATGLAAATLLAGRSRR